MTLPSPFALPRSEFNEFLFALIGHESNGMPLSVVSALARLDLDPWLEAARLSSLPRELAAPALDLLLRRLPPGRWKQTETPLIAARLIELLPRRGAGDPPPALRRKAVPFAILWLLVAGLVAAALTAALADDLRQADDRGASAAVANHLQPFPGRQGSGAAP